MTDSVEKEGGSPEEIFRQLTRTFLEESNPAHSDEEFEDISQQQRELLTELLSMGQSMPNDVSSALLRYLFLDNEGMNIDLRLTYIKEALAQVEGQPVPLMFVKSAMNKLDANMVDYVAEDISAIDDVNVRNRLERRVELVNQVPGMKGREKAVSDMAQAVEFSKISPRELDNFRNNLSYLLSRCECSEEERESIQEAINKLGK